MAKDESKRTADDPGYEQVISRLEDVIKRLEAGNLPLEESLKAFEEGIALVRAGEARLNEAEKRIEQLVASPSGDRVVPFEPEAAAQPIEARPPARAGTRGPTRPPPPDDELPPF